MASCIVCGKKELMAFKCKFCGSFFCSEHRLPENHECIGLKLYKEESRTKPNKWIYEPFQDRADEGIMRRKEPIFEKIERYLDNLDMRQVVYIIMGLIILLTILESIL